MTDRPPWILIQFNHIFISFFAAVLNDSWLDVIMRLRINVWLLGQVSSSKIKDEYIEYVFHNYFDKKIICMGCERSAHLVFVINCRCKKTLKVVDGWNTVLSCTGGSGHWGIHVLHVMSLCLSDYSTHNLTRYFDDQFKWCRTFPGESASEISFLVNDPIKSQVLACGITRVLIFAFLKLICETHWETLLLLIVSFHGYGNKSRWSANRGNIILNITATMVSIPQISLILCILFKGHRNRCVGLKDISWQSIFSFGNALSLNR